jgi:hypothetical protein
MVDMTTRTVEGESVFKPGIQDAWSSNAQLDKSSWSTESRSKTTFLAVPSQKALDDTKYCDKVFHEDIALRPVAEQCFCTHWQHLRSAKKAIDRLQLLQRLPRNKLSG